MTFAKPINMFTQELFTSDGLARQQPPQGNPQVLLVEDERVSRRALAALLAASGYQTEAVASAEEALSVLGEDGNLPRIALVDLNLPGMSGLDLIERLEQLDPDVYPVLITAQGGETLRAHLRDRGVGYLQKPVNFDRLLVMLAERQRPH
jgi:two-component system C4-dicarboxylate transport response regulator DctD